MLDENAQGSRTVCVSTCIRMFVGVKLKSMILLIFKSQIIQVLCELSQIHIVTDTRG